MWQRSLTVISVLLALVGIGLTWHSLRSKSPYYAVKGTNLASASMSKYGDLELRFAGRPVPRATVTYIGFWNEGREAIRREDIAPSDPIRVEMLHGASIMSCKIVKSSREVINAQLDLTDRKSPRILFDFLGHNDWVRIQVLHTGGNPSDCRIAGTIIDCDKGIGELSGDPPRAPYIAVLGFLCFSFIFGVYQLIRSKHLADESPERSSLYKYFAWLMMTLSLAGTLVVLYPQMTRVVLP